MVDIARPSQARKKKIRRAVYGAVAIAVIALISVGVSRLKPAAPTVDRAVVWIDTVKRSDFTRQVRGSGTLVPEDIRWIPAQTQGRVERILLRSGATVTPDTVILELSNPELNQTVTAAQLAYQAALAAFENRKAELQSGLLSQEADTANIEANYKTAALDLEANESLYKDGLISELTLKQKRGATDELKNRLAIAQRRLEITRQGVSSQLAPQEADVNQKKAEFELRRRQLEDLKVKAGMDGVLQCVCTSPTTPRTRAAGHPGHEHGARGESVQPQGRTPHR
jgi:HlyD family secretion protein